MTWSDDRAGTNQERAYLIRSTDGGDTYTSPEAGRRQATGQTQPAIAISPDGTDAYLVYNAYLAPWQTTTANPRPVLGVVRHADVGSTGAVGAGPSIVARSAMPAGRARTG